VGNFTAPQGWYNFQVGRVPAYTLNKQFQESLEMVILQPGANLFRMQKFGGLLCKLNGRIPWLAKILSYSDGHCSMELVGNLQRRYILTHKKLKLLYMNQQEAELRL